ncbi:unnamed protein product [Ambrosiozyma monospora]|uniref:Unnamed protein product n=1 Tax=Ambrosiozyma monospora TaxID=43982 RepID=A0ACB5SU33_AMBMO|nr:unnamed protein product [Ambrosiozyma monospora]
MTVIRDEQKANCNCKICGNRKFTLERELEKLYQLFFNAKTLAGDTVDSNQINSSLLDFILGVKNQQTLLAESLARLGQSTNNDGSLNVQSKTDVMSVAEDLLKNNGKRFIDMVEQLDHERHGRETLQKIPGAFPTDENHDNSDSEFEYDGENDLEEDGDEDEEEYEDDDDDDDDDEEDCDHDYDDEEDDDDDDEDEEDEEYTAKKRGEETYKLWQLITSKILRTKLMAAYKEKVAEDSRRQLIEELEAEERKKKAKEEEKRKKKEKIKEKKRQIQQAKEEERKRKEQERLEQERQHQEELKRKTIEGRKRKEAERKMRLEEKKRQKEEQRRKREAEQERQRKEKEEREAKKLEDRKRREAEKKKRDEEKRKQKEAKALQREKQRKLQEEKEQQELIQQQKAQEETIQKQQDQQQQLSQRTLSFTSQASNGVPSTLLQSSMPSPSPAAALAAIANGIAPNASNFTTSSFPSAGSTITTPSASTIVPPPGFGVQTPPLPTANTKVKGSSPLTNTSTPTQRSISTSTSVNIGAIKGSTTAPSIPPGFGPLDQSNGVPNGSTTGASASATSTPLPFAGINSTPASVSAPLMDLALGGSQLSNNTTAASSPWGFQTAQLSNATPVVSGSRLLNGGATNPSGRSSSIMSSFSFTGGKAADKGPGNDGGVDLLSKFMNSTSLADDKLGNVNSNSTENTTPAPPGFSNGSNGLVGGSSLLASSNFFGGGSNDLTSGLNTTTAEANKSIWGSTSSTSATSGATSGVADPIPGTLSRNGSIWNSSSLVGGVPSLSNSLWSTTSGSNTVGGSVLLGGANSPSGANAGTATAGNSGVGSPTHTVSSASTTNNTNNGNNTAVSTPKNNNSNSSNKLTATESEMIQLEVFQASAKLPTDSDGSYSVPLLYHYVKSLLSLQFPNLTMDQFVYALSLKLSSKLSFTFQLKYDSLGNAVSVMVLTAVQQQQQQQQQQMATAQQQQQKQDSTTASSSGVSGMNMGSSAVGGIGTQSSLDQLGLTGPPPGFGNLQPMSLNLNTGNNNLLSNGLSGLGGVSGTNGFGLPNMQMNNMNNMNNMNSMNMNLNNNLGLNGMNNLNMNFPPSTGVAGSGVQQQGPGQQQQQQQGQGAMGNPGSSLLGAGNVGFSGNVNGLLDNWGTGFL